MKALVTAAFAALIVMASAHAAAADAAKPGSKASSYAPRPKAKNGVYGTPIQPPIMGYRKSAHHKAGSPHHKASSKKKPGKAKAHGEKSGKGAKNRPTK
jgi:hypothetical protein